MDRGEETGEVDFSEGNMIYIIIFISQSKFIYSDDGNSIDYISYTYPKLKVSQNYLFLLWNSPFTLSNLFS